jgi:hypothetical protein
MSPPARITNLLARARVAGIRARLTADGQVELHGPASAADLGQQLRSREPELRDALEAEARALEVLHRTLAWTPENRVRIAQRALGLGDEAPAVTPSGHPLRGRS